MIETNILEDNLIKLGLPSNLVGYRYIVEGINYFITHNDMVLYNGLYRLLEEKYNTKCTLIERNIRYAIFVHFSNNINLNEVFGYSINFKKDRPSIKLYLTVISKYMKFILSE